MRSSALEAPLDREVGGGDTVGIIAVANAAALANHQSGERHRQRRVGVRRPHIAGDCLVDAEQLRRGAVIYWFRGASMRAVSTGSVAMNRIIELTTLSGSLAVELAITMDHGRAGGAAPIASDPRAAPPPSPLCAHRGERRHPSPRSDH
jgi:hypothetical protein